MHIIVTLFSPHKDSEGVIVTHNNILLKGQYNFKGAFVSYYIAAVLYNNGKCGWFSVLRWHTKTKTLFTVRKFEIFCRVSVSYGGGV